MTEPSTPELPADAFEVVSAYLDGEASASEMARVEADPELLAAVDRMGRTTQLLRADPPARDVVDRHVAAALDAFPAPSTGARVVDLGTERRRRWYDRVPVGVVAAAAVAIALVGAATQLDSDDGDDTATADVAAEDSGDAGGGDDASVFDADEGADGSISPGLEADAPSAAGGGSARPEFADTESLANHVRDVVAATRSGASTDDSIAGDGQAEQFEGEGEASSTCDALAAADLGDAPILLVLPASVSGREVTAVVADEGTGRRLAVIDDLTCEVVDERDL